MPVSTRSKSKKKLSDADEPKPVIVKTGYGKRALVASCLVTLFATWFVFSKKVIPLEIAKMSELVFEGAILQRLPISSFLSEDFLKNLTAIISPFSFADNLVIKDTTYLIGKELSQSGAKAKHPVVMVPGVINSSLELWKGRACGQKYFRQRLWGTLSMLRIMLLDKECWLEHMRLSPHDEPTLDPPSVRVRASQGLESSDFVLPGYWVWAKLIQNMADVGYDPSMLLMVPYDWRVDMEILESRDGYFTRLKSSIEQLRQLNKQKVVIAAHSLGSNVWLYFMQWVERDPKTTTPFGKGGGGGPTWISDHIHAFIDIAGPKLGVPKSLSCVISGEMKDTVQLGKLESYVLEKLLSKKERTSLFRTWTGPQGMQIKGPQIWNSCCDRKCIHGSPPMIEFVGETCGLNRTYDYQQSFDLFNSFLSKPTKERLSSVYSHDLPSDYSAIGKNKLIARKWINPLEVPLPMAPDLTIYTFYGIGKPTERSFIYKPSENGCEDLVNNVPFVINAMVENKEKGIVHGIYLVEGDGTVPLISNGLMSALFWKKREYNPAGARIVIREILHEPSSSVSEFRGGPKTADHVDIMGNAELMADFIKIITGFDAGSVRDTIISDINKISECLAL